MKSNLDILTYSEQISTRMKERLEEINVDQEELLRLGEALSFVRSLVAELKQFVASYKFTSKDEEIKFFKEVKPVLISQYFYHKRIFEIRLFDSFRDIKSRHANYYQLLRNMEKFVKRNHEFYEYCMTNQTFMDQHYFARNASIPGSFNRDEKFTTSFDTKLARILANELLKKYILAALRQSGHDGASPSLTWTGAKADFVELIYALHASQVFNNGAADIKEIATTFEDLFNTSLSGNLYRTFHDIRNRKGNQTAFLDEMKTRLKTKMTELD